VIPSLMPKGVEHHSQDMEGCQAAV